MTMFHTYNQPRMPRAYYAGPRWQYWWFRQPRKKYRHSKRDQVVYTGNPKGATAVCLFFLGIFFVISGIFMAGFGYSDSSSNPTLQIIGPVFVGLGGLMVFFGSILCVVVQRELTRKAGHDIEHNVVEESPRKEQQSNKEAVSNKPPLLLIINNNGNSSVGSPTFRQTSVSSSAPSTPLSPGNGVSLCQPLVVVTPPANGSGSASPKSPKLPFHPVGPAFPISEKQARAASMDKINEVGEAKKKKLQREESVECKSSVEKQEGESKSVDVENSKEKT